MKDFGCTVIFAEDRIRELLSLYFRRLRECRRISMPEVYRHIVQQPASRFWVSPERAAHVCHALLSGKDPLSPMRPTKREMFSEIYRRVCILMAESPGISVTEAARIVVYQPAPKQYLAPGSARIMIIKARRRWLDSRMSHLKWLSDVQP